MRHDNITLTGLVATDPKHLTTSEGLAITSFRLASSQGHYDRDGKGWIDKGTNWYTVSAFRRLALGTASSLVKGDRVIITGRLRLREWSNADRSGTSIEIDADALGHDLNWGTAKYTRTMGASESGSTEASTPAEGDTGLSTPSREFKEPKESKDSDDSTAESGEALTAVGAVEGQPPF